MALLYIGAGINHFWHPKFYLRIIPPYLPAPHFINSASGVAEIILGVLLMMKFTQVFAAWGIALMLLVFMLVHVYMLQQALSQPHYFVTPLMAWLRLALQPLLMAWALWYTRN